MIERDIALILFALVTISVLFCKVSFNYYLKDKRIDQNPMKTKRFTTIIEVVDFHIKNTNLTESEKKTLVFLRSWEIMNLFSLPILLVIWIILMI